MVATTNFNQYVDCGDVPSSSEEELDKYLFIIEVLLELLSVVHCEECSPMGQH